MFLQQGLTGLHIYMQDETIQYDVIQYNNK